MTGALLALALLAAGPASAQVRREPYVATPGLISPGGYILFYSVSGPLSWAPAVRKPAGTSDAGTAQGSACQRGIFVPVSFSRGLTGISGARGEGGFDAALADLRRRHPDLAGVYDLKVDHHMRNVLLIYRKFCVEISARGFK